MAGKTVIVRLVDIVPEIDCADPMTSQKSFLTSQLILCVLLLFICPSQTAAEKSYSLYLVRHAEKAEAPKQDPELTEKGHKTAQAFAAYLQDKNITRVFSTNYKRTIQTAEHFTKPRRILIQKYNPSDLAGFAKQLLDMTDTTYIVGHSNTTPTLIALLGGVATPIEEHEYGQIYELKVTESTVQTTVTSVH